MGIVARINNFNASQQTLELAQECARQIKGGFIPFIYLLGMVVCMVGCGLIAAAQIAAKIIKVAACYTWGAWVAFCRLPRERKQKPDELGFVGLHDVPTA